MSAPGRTTRKWVAASSSSARARAALHVEASALRAVAKAFPHRAVDEVAVRVARLEHGEGAAERGLRRAVLRAAGDAERNAVCRIRAEAVPRDGALSERRGEFGD